MADEGNAEAPENMTINVKTPKEQHQVEVPRNALVKDVSIAIWTLLNSSIVHYKTRRVIPYTFPKQLRGKVAEKFNSSEELLCLIFSGKIMKDTETLASHKLADGYTVHLVIKSSVRGPQEPPAPASGGTASPSTPQQPNANPTVQGIG